MTTLNDIIGRIDEQLLQAARAGAVTSLSSHAFREQEKIRKYVLVRIGAENIALPIEGLSEIGVLPAVTPLPNLPNWIRGIVSQRGEIISVIDLNMFLTPEKNQAWSGSRLAVLKAGSMKVGICVDRLIATISRPESDLIRHSGSDLHQAAPDVFRNALRVDNDIYQILQPDVFLGMEKLLQYHMPG